MEPVYDSLGATNQHMGGGGYNLPKSPISTLVSNILLATEWDSVNTQRNIMTESHQDFVKKRVCTFSTQTSNPMVCSTVTNDQATFSRESQIQ